MLNKCFSLVLLRASTKEGNITITEMERRQKHSDLLQDFIVGNYTEGFLGIERDRSVPARWNERRQYCRSIKV